MLYERYYDRVYGYCLYKLGSREEAEDAAQTTFLWAFRGLRRGVVPRAEANWLFTIAQNACRARQRSRGRRREREVLSDPLLLADLTPAPAGEHDELVGLEDALARMPELQRRAILLREWRGLSYREIATELELTAAAVETLIFRARRSLAELLAGRPAPKRARRFAFDCGSIGAALKSIFGAGAGGKLVAGAAAIIAATTLAGSAGQAPPARTPEPPAVTPSPRPDVGLPRTVEVTTVITKKPQAQRPAKPKSPTSASAEPTFPESSATLEQLLDETADSQPVVSSVTDALPVQETTGVVDGTVETVTGALPSTVSDALP